MRHQLETIWLEHREELRVFILQRVKSPAEAEDILQDVFLKMLSSLNARTRIAHPRGWLFAISRNAVVGYFRSKRPMEVIPEDLAGHSPDPDSVPIKEIGHCLTPMVNSLPVKLREAVVLADLEGMKQQVAEKLSISLAAVKSRILRGRSRMRRMIEDCCHLELDSRGSMMEYVPKGQGCSSGGNGTSCTWHAPCRSAPPWRFLGGKRRALQNPQNHMFCFESSLGAVVLW